MKILIVSNQRIKNVNGSFYSTDNFFDILNRFACMGNVSLCVPCLKGNENVANTYDSLLEKIIEKKNIILVKRNIIQSDFETRQILKREISKVDLVIGYLPSANASAACSIAKAYNKKYMGYVVSSPWDALWNHGLSGKIFAPYAFFRLRRTLRKADYALYVTGRYLQGRYPCPGITCGCSDVKIDLLNETILNNRLEILKKLSENDSLKIATIANNSIRYKGQHFVIKALAQLKKLGNTKFHYHLIGGGDKRWLQKLAAQLDVAEQVHFEGIVPHSKIFEKLEEMHLYIQPSLTEGLPRSVVEAMSRGLTCICADAGAMPEMVESKYIVKRKSVDDIVDILQNTSIEIMKQQAIRNFEEAKNYEDSVLEKKRNDFFEIVKKDVLG